MEEKDIMTITKNVVANFIDDEDKFIKQQTIDHIIQNGKYYDVISISKARVKKIVENGLKYEQLKKENKELKELIAFRNTGRVSGKLVAEKVLRFNDLQEENTRLKAEFAEKDRLLENAIVPKFKVGDRVWAVIDYFSEETATGFETVIENGIVEEIRVNKYRMDYLSGNRIYREQKYEYLFATEEEAQQKLKELEGK